MLVLLELAGQAGAAVSFVVGGLAMAVGVPFFAPAMLGAPASQLLLRPKRGELAATAALAALLALPLDGVATGPDTGLFAVAATALGLASLAVLAVAALRARGSDDRTAVDAFLPAAILPAFALLSYPMVYLTVALWPTTWDHRLYLADLAFGAPLSFVVGRAAAAVPLLNALCLAVYVALPLALLVVHALRRRQGIRSADAIVAFVALTTVGWLAYQLVPVAGPVWTFGAAFPLSPPDPSTLAAAKVVVVPAPRNCMPSLHSAWALLVWWLARPLPRAARSVATAFLAITLLATVGLGFHYVVDLVAAFPLTTAVHAWATTGRDARLRRTAIVAGAALTLAWMALVTAGTGLLAATPLLPWAASSAVVGLSCVLSSRVHAARDDEPAAAAEEEDVLPWPRRAAVALGAVAAAATFVHWAIYANALGVLLGGGASVRTGLGALLLASLAAGLAAARASGALAPMPGAAGAALLLAAASAASPAALAFASTSALGAADFPASLLSALPLLLPSGFCTGLLAGFLARAAGRPALLLEAAPPAVAFAALATAYLVMPSLYSSQLPTALHAVVALGAVALAAVAPGTVALAPGATGAFRGDSASAPAEGGDSASAWPLVAVAMLAGVALEATGHLRSVVAGDTVHARAHATIAVALGVALGAAFARRAMPSRERDGIAAAALGLAASVALVLPLWPALPGYFASFRDYAVQHATVTTFAEREFVRLALAALTLLPASACAGAALVFASARRAQAPVFVARAAAATAALAAGVALGAFALVPFAGSAASLAAVVVAAALLAAGTGRSAPWVAASLAVAAMAPLSGSLDLGALNSGSGLVFAPAERAPWLEAIETADGIVSAHRRPDGGIEVSVNGRARGDGAAVFAAAARRAPGRGRALLLGLGTGETARRLLEAGFAEVVVAESDEGVVRLAADVFAPENGDVLRDPRLRWSRDDGRRSLELGDGVADFVAIDVPEASAPGAAALLTREASAHAKRRLVPGGLLAQRLDLAELSPLALGSVLAAARASFAHAGLRFDGDDAMMLASDVPPARPDEAAGWLSPEAVDRLLGEMAAQIGVQAAALAASDRDLFLAYQAPKTVTQHADPAQRSLSLLQGLAAGE